MKSEWRVTSVPGALSRGRPLRSGDRIMQTIGDRIKAAREAAGLTQQQLADAVEAGGGRQQVSNWENSRRAPRLETLERIAAACGVTPGWLMFGE